MGELRKRMEADLRVAGYSANTQRIYVHCAKGFAAHFMRSPAQIGAEEVRTYFLHLTEQGISRSTQRQVRAALAFLYRVTLNQPMAIDWLPVPKRKKPLPIVLDPLEASMVISAIRSPRFRVIAMAMYGSGLRVSEACALQCDNIDSKRMVLHIVDGKGGKDRYTVLPKQLLCSLRQYWRLVRPAGPCLFPGRRSGTIRPCSVRSAISEACQEAGIGKTVTPHTFRHSFATQLVHDGVELAIIQVMLGHTSIRTTQRYVHISIPGLGEIPNPLDRLKLPPPSF